MASACEHAENVFDDDASNQEVFERSGGSKVVGSFLQGYLGTIFVYGQTGAGKTHTMSAFTELTASQIFARLQDDTAPPPQLSVSIMEVYNDSIRDLQSSEGGSCLQVRLYSRTGLKRVVFFHQMCVPCFLGILAAQPHVVGRPTKPIQQLNVCPSLAVAMKIH
jgi:hypothetical protein